MQALTIWKTVARDKANFLEELVALLARHNIRYCVIGRSRVNAYAEPLISLDLDLVIAADQIDTVVHLAKERFRVEEFPHCVNISMHDSGLRVQIQTDPRYLPFPERARERDVLGLQLPVAQMEDVLQGKIWAAQDPSPRRSKRRKALLDIERLVEPHPHLRDHVPAEILDELR